VRIPKTPIQTSWRADWLIEFGIALTALAFLTREIIFTVIGAGILLVLASLGLLFLRRLGVLRGQLYVAARLPRARVMLGDSIEGDLTIQNESRLAARVLVVTPVVEKGLSLRLSSSSSQLLRPDTTSSSKFEITSLKSGRFQISGFALTFTDARGLFTGEVSYEQDDWVEVYPGVRTKAPITPLRLYGGSPEILRKTPTGMDYAGIRQYMPGDEYCRVEWKATARHRTLMVKEFHPETQATLQILIDAGRTMHQQSYVGTRLDEALAVAQLLVESTVGSGTRVGILVYNETEIMRDLKSSIAEEQLVNLRELALALRVQATAEQRSGGILRPRSTLRVTPSLPVRLSKRIAMFIQSFRLGLRNAGIYKALDEASRAGPEGTTILLTDLQANNDSLVEAVADQRERRVQTIVARIGAAWRMSDTLESAYLEYLKENRSLQILRRLGATMFDVRPERLFDMLVQEISGSTRRSMDWDEKAEHMERWPCDTTFGL